MYCIWNFVLSGIGRFFFCVAEEKGVRRGEWERTGERREGREEAMSMWWWGFLYMIEWGWNMNVCFFDIKFYFLRSAMVSVRLARARGGGFFMTYDPWP